MQRNIEIQGAGGVLRGMEHIPDQVEGLVPAAVICHGFTADKLGPHQILRKLSLALERAGVASFRFDFTGSGESDGRFQDVTLSGEVNDVHLILDTVLQDKRIDARQVALVGHSMGGLAVGMVAGDRPQDVSRLVMIAPAGNLREFVFRLAQQAGLTSQTGLSMEVETFDWGGFLVGRAFAMDLFGIETFERAKPFRKDVLLVHGTHDATVPCAVSEQFRTMAYGGRAKVHWIAGADHTFSSHAWETEVIDLTCAFLCPDSAAGRAEAAHEQS